MPVGSNQVLQSPRKEDSTKDSSRQPASENSSPLSDPVERPAPEPWMLRDPARPTGFPIPVLLMALAPALWLPLLLFQFNTPSTTASDDQAPVDQEQDLIAGVPPSPSSQATRAPLQPGSSPDLSGRRPGSLVPLATQPSAQDLGEPSSPPTPIRTLRSSVEKPVAAFRATPASRSTSYRRPVVVRDSLADLPSLPRRPDPQPPKSYVSPGYEGVADADPVVQPNRDILVDPPITLADSPRQPSSTPVNSHPRWEPSPYAPQESAPPPAQSAALPGELDSHVAPPPSW